MVTKDDTNHQPLAFTRACTCPFPHAHTQTPAHTLILADMCCLLWFYVFGRPGLKVVLWGRGQPYLPGSVLGCASCTLSSTSEG